jgi:hypothetical protein
MSRFGSCGDGSIRQSRSHVGSPYYFRRLRPVATSPPTLGPGASAVLVPVMIRTPVLSYAAAPAAQRLAWLARKWWPHSSSSTGCVRLSATVTFLAPPGQVITIAAATGGHVAAVERFAVTGARAG